MRVGIVAASSVVPRVEFELGVAHLRDSGFEVTVHPQVLEQSFLFAGTDEQRANALYDFARDVLRGEVLLDELRDDGLSGDQVNHGEVVE